MKLVEDQYVREGWDADSPDLWAWVRSPLGVERATVWSNGSIQAVYFSSTRSLITNVSVGPETAEYLAEQCLQVSLVGDLC